MAYLIAWFSFDGRQIEDAAWDLLICGAKRHAPSTEAGRTFEWREGSTRAFALKVRASDPEPMFRPEGGRVLLADCPTQRLMPVSEIPVDEPGALIEIDTRRQRLRLSRDRLGQRPLVWARLAGGVLVCSKESVLLAHPEVGRALCSEYVAAHIACVNTPPGRSLYENVRLVDPGSLVEIDRSTERYSYLSYEPDERAYRLSDTDAANRFRELLADSVYRACGNARKLGITLSAGLDSSSIAALLPTERRGPETVAVTYGMTLNNGVDERPLATELATRLGLQLRSIDAARYPALLQQTHPKSDPGHPSLNPYRPLKMAVYEEFRTLDVDVVLTGNFGDHWVGKSRTWLLDALQCRRWDVVWHEYSHLRRNGGLVALWRDGGWRHATRTLIGIRNRSRGPDWMRPRWRNYLAELSNDEQFRFRHWPRPDLAAYNFGAATALDGAYEGHYADVLGIDLRHPFRDWGFLQFALSLPAYQGRRNGSYKWIARQAMAAVLPPRWVDRPKQGDLMPLLEHSDFMLDPDIYREAIERCLSIWEEFVDPREVAFRLSADPSVLIEDDLLWLLASLSVWQTHCASN